MSQIYRYLTFIKDASSLINVELTISLVHMSLYYMYIEKGSRALRVLYLLGKALSWDSVYIGTLLGTDDETAGHCSCPETHLLCRSPKKEYAKYMNLNFLRH